MPSRATRARERRLVAALGHLALDPAVEVLVLHEDDRVGVAHGGDQQALGVLGRRGRDDLQPGRVHEPRLGVLRVERAAREAAAGGQPDGDVHRQALPVVHLAGDVDELVEAAGDEVRELHLADRPHPLDGGADGAADDRRLGQRRVHHAVGAELVDEAVGHLEGAAEDADVLAHHEDALVGAHLLAHRVGDRLQVGHRRHQAAPSANPLHGRVAVLEQRRLVGEHAVGRPSSGSGIGDASASSTAASISP